MSWRLYYFLIVLKCLKQICAWTIHDNIAVCVQYVFYVSQVPATTENLTFNLLSVLTDL